MNKLKLLIVFSWLALLNIQASTSDSIWTSYSNGEFYTNCRITVNASDSICEAVLRDFDHQMKYKLDNLFSWALKGMNLRKEKSELMMFYFKSTSFQKSTNTLKFVGDVIVPGITTIHDVKVDSRLNSTYLANGKKTFSLLLISSTGFIKGMNSTFKVIPEKGQTKWFILETKVKFGWFFDLFITRKRFGQIMEWRLKRFVQNLKNEAEKRELNSLSYNEMK